MVDNQHQKIKGYRDLSQEEIDLMNEGKELSEKVGAYIEKLRASDAVPTEDGIDQRWLSIAQTHLQQGFMAAIRSIARPTTF